MHFHAMLFLPAPVLHTRSSSVYMYMEKYTLKKRKTKIVYDFYLLAVYALLLRLWRSTRY